MNSGGEKKKKNGEKEVTVKSTQHIKVRFNLFLFSHKTNKQTKKTNVVVIPGPPGILHVPEENLPC